MGINWKDHNLYELLEVPQDASQQVILEAFRRARETYSQDNPALYNTFTKEEASELMQLIEDAFEILKNSQLRKSYDQSLDEVPQFEKSSSITQLSSESPIEKFPNFKPTGTETPLPKRSEDPKKNFILNEKFENEIESQTVFDGKFLKQIRLYRNVSLDQISTASRISKTYLNAIENNDFVSLPAPVFVRGFIVQYAKILCLNEKKVANSFMKLYIDSVGK